jgi:hypothetical protein
MNHYELREIAMTVDTAQANIETIESKELPEAEVYYHLMPGDYGFYAELPYPSPGWKVVDRVWSINRTTGTAKALVRLTPATIPAPPPPK